MNVSLASPPSLHNSPKECSGNAYEVLGSRGCLPWAGKISLPGPIPSPEPLSQKLDFLLLVTALGEGSWDVSETDRIS